MDLPVAWLRMSRQKGKLCEVQRMQRKTFSPQRAPVIPTTRASHPAFCSGLLSISYATKKTTGFFSVIQGLHYTPLASARMNCSNSPRFSGFLYLTSHSSFKAMCLNFPSIYTIYLQVCNGSLLHLRSQFHATPLVKSS